MSVYTSIKCRHPVEINIKYLGPILRSTENTILLYYYNSIKRNVRAMHQFCSILYEILCIINFRILSRILSVFSENDEIFGNTRNKYEPTVQIKKKILKLKLLSIWQKKIITNLYLLVVQFIQISTYTRNLKLVIF